MNIINQWGERQRGGKQIFKVQWGGGSKRGRDTVFDFNLVGGKTLEETMNRVRKLRKSQIV